MDPSLVCTTILHRVVMNSFCSVVLLRPQRDSHGRGAGRSESFRALTGNEHLDALYAWLSLEPSSNPSHGR